MTLTAAMYLKLRALALDGVRWAFEALMNEIRLVNAVDGNSPFSALLAEDRAILEQLANAFDDSGDQD